MLKRIVFVTAVLLALVVITVPVLAGTGQQVEPGALGMIGFFVVGLVANASTIAALQKNFQALFRSAYEEYETTWPRVAMEAPSEGAEENYQWLGDVPSIKEWIDSKTLEQLRGFQYTIRNKDWEGTITVDRNDIEDDRLGIYRPRIIELGQEAKRHPEELVSTTRRAGVTELCYDGQFFYDTDHVIGKSGTLSNKLTGTGATLAQVKVDFTVARKTLRNFKNDQGKPFIRRAGKLALLCTIPADLEGVFEELANATLISNTTNVLKGAFDYQIDPYLTDANDWYLDYIGAPIKPFVFQNRKRPDFVALDNPNTTESVFMRKKLAYGVEARYNAGYGFWQYSILTTNT